MVIKMNETNVIEIKVNVYKSIFKLSIICFFIIIFVVPFSVFAFLTLFEYLKASTDKNLSPFILVTTILSFLVFFYVLFELLLFKKIKNNKNYLEHKSILLSYLNFIFSFITSTILIVYSIKSIIEISGNNIKIFKKSKK